MEQKTIFEAEDGTRFDEEAECEKHEANLGLIGLRGEWIEAINKKYAIHARTETIMLRYAESYDRFRETGEAVLEGEYPLLNQGKADGTE